MFQLSPAHDVFRSSSLNNDYVSISKASGEHAGIAFGCPVLKHGRSGELRHLGPVSLVLDSGFEHGVFTHDYNSRGGAFRTSSSKRYDFQDRFQITDLEVWSKGRDGNGRREKRSLDGGLTWVRATKKLTGSCLRWLDSLVVIEVEDP